MANADLVRLARVKEAGGAYGVHPGGNLQEFRYTGDSLVKQSQLGESAEIRSDRMTADAFRLGISVQGGVDFELSFGSSDDLIHSALFDAGAAPPSSSVELDVNGNAAVQVTAATGTVEDPITAGTMFANVLVGDWISLSNFANAANNQLVKVLTKPSADLITVAGAAPLADETRAADASGANAKIVRGGTMVNGSTFSSYTVVREYTELVGDRFAILRGLVVGGMTLNVQAGEKVTGSFSFLGQDEDPIAAAAGGTFVAANTKPVMTASENVLDVLSWPSGSALPVNQDNTLESTRFQFQLDNQLRGQPVIGQPFVRGVVAAKCRIEGTLETYFADRAELDAFHSFELRGIACVLSAPTAVGSSGLDAYVFEIPAAHFGEAPHSPSGEGTDVMLPLGWRAKRHPSEGVMIRVARFENI